MRRSIRQGPNLTVVSAVPATSPLFSLSSMDADRERVEAAMQAAVITTDPHLTELASHLLVAGGKRLRPVMTLAAARVGGAEAGDAAVQGGVACELVHLGSLYHDDVMDDSPLRRGVETVNAKWGNLQAILAGDFLLARASEIAASLGTEVAALLARTIGWLCEGQIEELRHTYDPGRDEESYLRSIQGKTAALYGTAARIGGIVAGCERHVIEALTELGANYGMVFQIVDDILDLTATEEQLGKPAGHDLVEGVYTLPVIRTLASGLPAATALAAMLGNPLGDDERMATLDIVRRNEGIEGAVSTARRYVEAAERAGADLPASESTDALRESARALVDSVSATAT